VNTIQLQKNLIIQGTLVEATGQFCIADNYQWTLSSLCLNFFQPLARKPNLDKNSICSN